MRPAGPRLPMAAQDSENDLVQRIEEMDEIQGIFE
jgi:hypothetical protein